MASEVAQYGGAVGGIAGARKDVPMEARASRRPWLCSLAALSIQVSDFAEGLGAAAGDGDARSHVDLWKDVRPWVRYRSRGERALDRSASWFSGEFCMERGQGRWAGGMSPREVCSSAKQEKMGETVRFGCWCAVCMGREGVQTPKSATQSGSRNQGSP